MANILPFSRSFIKGKEPHRPEKRAYWWADYDLVEIF